MPRHSYWRPRKPKRLFGLPQSCGSHSTCECNFLPNLRRWISSPQLRRRCNRGVAATTSSPQTCGAASVAMAGAGQQPSKPIGPRSPLLLSARRAEVVVPPVHAERCRSSRLREELEARKEERRTSQSSRKRICFFHNIIYVIYIQKYFLCSKY
jgi:hypothetical protein